LRDVNQVLGTAFAGFWQGVTVLALAFSFKEYYVKNDYRNQGRGVKRDPGDV